MYFIRDSGLVWIIVFCLTICFLLHTIPFSYIKLTWTGNIDALNTILCQLYCQPGPVVLRTISLSAGSRQFPVCITPKTYTIIPINIPCLALGKDSYDRFPLPFWTMLFYPNKVLCLMNINWKSPTFNKLSINLPQSPSTAAFPGTHCTMPTCLNEFSFAVYVFPSRFRLKTSFVLLSMYTKISSTSSIAFSSSPRLVDTENRQ